MELAVATIERLCRKGEEEGKAAVICGMQPCVYIAVFSTAI